MFVLGTKNYDTDWYLKYGLSYKGAAKMLREWGFSFILTQSRFLPMADSAVSSEVSPDHKERFASYDELKFREALATEGIEYWPTLCTFFNPSSLKDDPTLRPIDADGVPMPMIDWYVGINPARGDFIKRQADLLSMAVKELSPDGVFLSFIRWPGFWELWMPHHRRSDFPEYSFDPHSLRRFQEEIGIQLPDLTPEKAADWINSNSRQDWTQWKCDVITGVVHHLRAAATAVNPATKMMINTLPFGYADYDNARDHTFGQHLESLAEVVDIFEVMTYHQILNRPVEWIAQIGNEVKNRTRKKTVCTLQVEPLYLNGIHAAEKRSSSIDSDEFAHAIEIAKGAGLDGVVVFTWSDLLRKALVERDKTHIRALQTAVDEGLAETRKNHD